MRGVLLATVALIAGPAAPPSPPAERPPCPAGAKDPRPHLLQAENPSAAQRHIPGLF